MLQQFVVAHPFSVSSVVTRAAVTALADTSTAAVAMLHPFSSWKHQTCGVYTSLATVAETAQIDHARTHRRRHPSGSSGCLRGQDFESTAPEVATVGEYHAI